MELLFLSKFSPTWLMRTPISTIPGGFIRCRARGYWLQGCGGQPLPQPLVPNARKYHWDAPAPTHTVLAGALAHGAGILLRLGAAQLLLPVFLPVPQPRWTALTQTQSSDLSPAWSVPSFSLESCMYAQLLTCVRLFVTPWTVPHQAPLSMGCSRQEYWSGLPILSPGDLPNAGTKPAPLASRALQVGSSPLCHQGSPWSLGGTLFSGAEPLFWTSQGQSWP